MKRSIALVVGLAVGVVASIGFLATTARPSPQPYGPAIGPTIARDAGAGEQVLLVEGGVYPTKEEADAAAAAMVFGDVQGYYVVPIEQFAGLREQVGSATGRYALVSAFRTEEGAAEFASFAGLFGHPATILPLRVLSLGGAYAGLGQEENSEGTGPILGPVRDSLS